MSTANEQPCIVFKPWCTNIRVRTSFISHHMLTQGWRSLQSDHKIYFSPLQFGVRTIEITKELGTTFYAWAFSSYTAWTCWSACSNSYEYLFLPQTGAQVEWNAVTVVSSLLIYLIFQVCWCGTTRWKQWCRNILQKWIVQMSLCKADTRRISLNCRFIISSTSFAYDTFSI